MKKALLAAIISATMATSAVFGTNESMSFTGPASWTPGTQITLNVFLTFAGYNSPGFSYWLEVNNAVAPFLSILSHTNVSFTDPNNVNPKPALFNLNQGTAGNMVEGNDLGATTPPASPVPPGMNIPIGSITFMLDAGASSLAGQTFTIATTTLSPKASEVTSLPDFNDNAIARSTFSFTIVPEPSTFALIGVGAVVSGMLAYRRRKTTR